VTMRISGVVVFLLMTSHVLASPAAQAPRPLAIFAIKTNEFWLNLHHFLYVLGQGQGRPPASLRDAVRSAPADAERGLQHLTAAEQKTWADAVAAYANGLSTKDPTLDEPLAAMIGALASADDAATLTGARVDADARAVLERAAPIYRKAWWPAHRSGNQAYQTSLQGLIERHGRAILDVFTALGTQARALRTSVPRDLPHAMIFFTAGEAVRRVEPTHVSVADAFGIWPLRLSGASLPAQRLKPLLEEIWKPYLDGRGTRDEALSALVVRAAAVSAP
jgi:hypothetical protein